jgi:hypothetical protein
MNPFVLFAMIAFCAVAQTQDSSSRSLHEAGQLQVLWRMPRNATLQDGTCGFAGCDHAPTPPFQLVKEDVEGTSPKVSVTDSKGRSWSVKFGAKVVPECFGSRFVTALGYFVEPSYCVGGGKLEGASRLHRAR